MRQPKWWRLCTACCCSFFCCCAYLFTTTLYIYTRTHTCAHLLMQSKIMLHFSFFVIVVIVAIVFLLTFSLRVKNSQIGIAEPQHICMETLKMRHVAITFAAARLLLLLLLRFLIVVFLSLCWLPLSMRVGFLFNLFACFSRSAPINNVKKRDFQKKRRR